MAGADGIVFADEVAKLESEFGIPTGLYRDLLEKGERSGQLAVSPKGAIGMAQLRPGTARDMGVTDIWDPEQNLRGGAKYFRTLYNKFGDWDLALAGYNAGPRRVEEAGGIPDVAKGYVARVRGKDVADVGGNTAMTGAMQQALTREQQMMPELDAATKAAQEANTTFAKSLQQSQPVYDKLLQNIEDLPPPPLPPTLKSLPEPPDPTKFLKDPTRALGQFLPALAVLGGLATRRAATTAFKSAAAAMKAAKENDHEALQAAHEEWKDKMDSALKAWEAERDEYLDVINNRRMSLEDRLSELRVLAAKNGDQQAMAAAANGNLDMIYKKLQAGDTAFYHLATLADRANYRDIQRDQLKEKAEKDAADTKYKEAMLEERKATTSKETLSQFIARQLQRKRDIGKDWDDNDQRVLDEAESDFQRLNFGAGATATPSPSPSPAPGGRPQSDAPPVSMLKPGVETTFKGKGTWTLKDGKPVRVR